MTEAIWDRILVVSWAVSLALLTLFGLGFTPFFSLLFGERHMLLAIDVALLLLSALYAVLLLRFAPRACSPLFKVVAILPPCLILWFLLF